MNFTTEKICVLKVDGKYVKESVDFLNVHMKSGVVFKKVRLSYVGENLIQISINGYSRCILLCEVKEIEFLGNDELLKVDELNEKSRFSNL